ncbi:hypothetical protein CALCODRAFT_117928 [Calocera cornea HHB12733]|uniref:Uncharacterized protein n=1 Tax=Calocera cornea HHB12733 TaxID=1353952 RepID=A0A165IDF0_9BASI|nr:hypothetical protein CALCODRAFT_117928 [Calocera cornea HHB12733]
MVATIMIRFAECGRTPTPAQARPGARNPELGTRNSPLQASSHPLLPLLISPRTWHLPQPAQCSPPSQVVQRPRPAAPPSPPYSASCLITAPTDLPVPALIPDDSEILVTRRLPTRCGSPRRTARRGRALWAAGGRYVDMWPIRGQ